MERGSTNAVAKRRMIMMHKPSYVAKYQAYGQMVLLLPSRMTIIITIAIRTSILLPG